MDNNNIEQTITFNGISDRPEYKTLVFPATTTLLETFICIVPIILAAGDVDIVHTGLNHLLYGAESSFRVPDSEFSNLIVHLLNDELVVLNNDKHISLTKKGRIFTDFFYIFNRKVLREGLERVKKDLSAMDT